MGDGGLHPESMPSSAAPIPAWGTLGAACEGQGWRIQDGWWVRRRAQERCCHHGRAPAPGCASAVLGSSHLSPLPAFLVPAPTGEGRKEGEHPHLSGARVQIYLLSWEGVSLCSWEGEINR